MKVRVPRLVVSVLLASGALAACSAKAPPSDAYVNASAQGLNGSCNFSGKKELFLIGSDTTDGGGISANPTRVQNGTNEGGAVGLSCSVKGTGAGNYDIALSADLTTSQVGAGGSMTITGTVNSSNATAGSVGAMQTIAGSFGAADNTYTETDCTITYPTIPQGGPVAPGRIWGEIDCPNAVLQGQTLPGGGPITCDISALFVFENCGS
jgi:hypothetical protein